MVSCPRLSRLRVQLSSQPFGPCNIALSSQVPHGTQVPVHLAHQKDEGAAQGPHARASKWVLSRPRAHTALPVTAVRCTERGAAVTAASWPQFLPPEGRNCDGKQIGDQGCFPKTLSSLFSVWTAPVSRAAS